jgi:hypothetical protein
MSNVAGMGGLEWCKREEEVSGRVGAGHCGVLL